MNAKRILVLAAATAAFALGAATLEEINARLTVLGAEQIQLHGDTKDIAEALDREFRSARHDTPEMKALRQRIEDMKNEVAAAEAELRRQFNALPQFRDKAAMVSTNAVRLRAIANERGRLLREREAITKAAEQQPQQQ